MEPTVSKEEAMEIGQALEGIRMLIQYALGQNQALQVALGSALGGLPPESLIRTQVLSSLEGWRRLMQADPRSLGQIDGFDSVSSALAAAMGEVEQLTSRPGSARGH